MARPLRIGYKMETRNTAGLSKKQKASMLDPNFGVETPPGFSKKLMKQLKKELIKNSR